MVSTIFVKSVANMVVSAILLVTYVYFFGQKSIRRYLEKSVIITEQEEKHAFIPQPGND